MYTGYLVDIRDSHAGQGITTANLDNPNYPHNWKQILGITSALVYLTGKKILHNKSDNILMEMLPTEYYSAACSMLIDFNKACFEEDGVTYKLSNEESKKICQELSSSCSRNTLWYRRTDSC